MREKIASVATTHRGRGRWIGTLYGSRGRVLSTTFEVPTQQEAIEICRNVAIDNGYTVLRVI